MVIENKQMVMYLNLFNFGCATVASQTIIITKPNEIELIKDIQLA